MKNKRIWMVMLLILVVGGISTTYTKQYVTEQALIVMESQAVSGEGTVTAAQVEIEANAKADAAPAMMMAPIDGDPVAEQNVSSEPETVENSEKQRSKARIVEPESAKQSSGYLTRLEELDVQIEKKRATDVDNSVNYPVKARVENERKLWDIELDSIVTVLKERLSETEKEALIAQQREWAREREAIAIEASKKQSGSSLEEVEYTISLAATTRSRAYTLVKEYEAILNQ